MIRSFFVRDRIPAMLLLPVMMFIMGTVSSENVSPTEVRQNTDGGSLTLSQMSEIVGWGDYPCLGCVLKDVPGDCGDEGEVDPCQSCVVGNNYDDPTCAEESILYTRLSPTKLDESQEPVNDQIPLSETRACRVYYSCESSPVLSNAWCGPLGSGDCGGFGFYIYRCRSCFRGFMKTSVYAPADRCMDCPN